MVQQIDDPYRKGGISAIGAGIGRGLSEQLPKEMQQYRLSKGLQKFVQNSQNLNPMQQIAYLSSIPGISSQMIQSLGNLAKTNAYGNFIQNYAQSQGAGTRQPPLPGEYSNQVPQASQAIRDVGGFSAQTPQQVQPGKTPSIQPQIGAPGPLRSEAIPPKPMSPQEKNIRKAEYINMGATPDIADQLAEQDAQYLLDAAQAEREKDIYRESVEGKADEQFKTLLEQKLQKFGPETFQDLTGEMQNNLRIGMENDLANNPNLSIRQAADKWTDKALELSRTKNQLKQDSNRSILKNLYPHYRESLDRTLKGYGKLFKDANNSQDYYNDLITQYGLSPRYAAYYAYPINDKINKYISNSKTPKDIDLSNPKKHIAKYVSDISKLIDKDDSIYSIIANMEDKIYGFNANEFIDYMGRHQEELMLNDRQRRELNIVEDWLPNWADMFIMPTLRGKL